MNNRDYEECSIYCKYLKRISLKENSITERNLLYMFCRKEDDIIYCNKFGLFLHCNDNSKITKIGMCNEK